MSQFFRPTARALISAVPTSLKPTTPRTKLSTGLVGLAIHPSPLTHLLSLYSSTLSLLSQIPSSAVYRQSVESITKERIEVISGLKESMEGENAIKAVEDKLGLGNVEEVIEIAEGELKLVGKMIEWKSWEALEEPAPKGQWDPFHITPSTTTFDDLK